MTGDQLHAHAALKDYERGTKTWLRQIGHWHVTPQGGRRWIKGSVGECPDVQGSAS